MRKIEMSQYLTEKVVREVVRKYWNKLENLPGMVELVENWDSNLLEIESKRQIQEQSVKGAGELKLGLRQAMIDVVFEICRKTHVYGRLTGNDIVAAKTAYRKRDFLLVPDTVARDVAMVVVKCAESELEHLCAYGVDLAMLVAARDAIVAYEAAISAPRLAVVRRMGATRRIGELLNEDVVLLRRLDLLMDLIGFDEPELYGLYRNTRHVVVMGVERLALKMRVVEKETGNGIAGVLVVLRSADGRKVTELRKRTGAKGGFYVWNMASGRYSAEVSKPGFVSLVCEAIVLKGEMCKVEVGMEGVEREVVSRKL